MNSYLRLHPEMRARVNGPKSGKEPAIVGLRHPVLQGFEETDIIPFGGTLLPLSVDQGATVPLTFVPEFPAFPPETAWMRVADSGIPGLVVSQASTGARVAYLAADLDRRYQRELLPDHANLLANLVRWGAKDSIPLSVYGAGLIDCHLYGQPGRMILHLVNLTSAGTWRSPMDELIPIIGPLQVRIKLAAGVAGRTAKRLVAPGAASVTVRQGWAELEVKSILDHEVIVIA
ncbi:MAG: hypothetical protein WDO73_03615 [Ignavibacteriota bacterium]